MFMESGLSVPPLKKWIVAFRPWALPASSMPVIFGTSLAVVIGRADFLIGRFILALAGMMILHTASNMLSDVFDFRRGLDTQPTPVSGAIVRGWLSPRQVAAGSAVLFLAGALIGLYLVSVTGRLLLWIGVVGVVIGVVRRSGRFPELRPARLARRLGCPDRFFLLDSDHLDYPHGHARQRNPPCQQLAGFLVGQGKAGDDGRPVPRRPGLTPLLRIPDIRLNDHHRRIG
jgi:hypothetical protein